MLVIPELDLRHGRCVRPSEGRHEEERAYFDDPVQMAKLWRLMNAKTLHVVDVDAARGVTGDAPSEENRAVLAEIVAALDTPVQVGGARTLGDVEVLLGLGVYRVVLDPVAARDVGFVEEAIRRHRGSRVVVGLDGRGGAADLAAELEQRGVRRFVYSDGAPDGPDVEAYRALAQRLQRAQITASGGVRSYPDLLVLQALKPRVDSVIVGQALYENCFPCQQFWCWHDLHRVDLTRASTAPLADA